MKILLIGAGYVGRHLLHTWQNPQDQFSVMTTSQEKVSQLEQIPSVKKVFMVDQLKEGIEACDALIITIAPKEGASYEETYLKTAKTIQTLLKHREQSLYLLYTSSISVYRQSERGKILLETEKLYQECGVSTCILRLGGIYGPGRELESRARRLSGREMEGGGNQPTNHSHLDDIVRGIEFCVEKQCVGIYDLVSDAHPTREELYNALCEEQGLPPPKWVGKSSNVAVSNEKIKNEGFVFLHPLL